MRLFVLLAVGVFVAAVGLWCLLPERVQIVVHDSVASLSREMVEWSGDLAPARPPPPPPRTLFKLDAERSKVGFDGASSLHDFTGATTHVKGEIEFRLDAPADAPRALVEIDARTLDTGNGSRDKDMHRDYLESAKWTTMQFRLESLADLKAQGATRFDARARGTFTCHGKEKEVEAPFKLERVGATGLRVEGELRLKMSDFGITPPTAMGGLIRTHDDVRVWFVLQGRSEP